MNHKKTKQRKQQLKQRYERLREAGFSANESNIYKYHKDDNITVLIKRKKRCDKLVAVLEFNYDQAWQMAGSYTDEDVNELLKSQL